MARERLQKVLAAAGVAARRACEQLILDGRVQVNGRPVVSLPVLVDPRRDRITVDGKPLTASRLVYFVLNKPRGVLCTNADPAGRLRAIDLLGGVRERVFPVGRLDADSTGLLLMTNDGELAERLSHPRYGVPRTYRAEVEGRVEQEDLERLRRGVWLAEGKTGPAHAKIVLRQPHRSILEITLREGRNREIRRVLARVGHKVRRLKRVAIGPIQLQSLPIGAYRPLKPKELDTLRRHAEHAAASSLKRRRESSKSKVESRNKTSKSRNVEKSKKARRREGKKALRRAKKLFVGIHKGKHMERGTVHDDEAVPEQGEHRSDEGGERPSRNSRRDRRQGHLPLRAGGPGLARPCRPLGPSRRQLRSGA